MMKTPFKNAKCGKMKATHYLHTYIYTYIIGCHGHVYSNLKIFPF